jgi:hypothetical protein
MSAFRGRLLNLGERGERPNLLGEVSAPASPPGSYVAPIETSIKDEGMDTQLSAAALALLRHCLATKDSRVGDENREVYRELVRVGFMIPLHTPLGRESAYRMTQESVDFCLLVDR